MLTKEEKAIAINYVRMAYKKGWCKPGEYNIINIIDNYHHQAIYEIENIIDKEWNKLEKEYKHQLLEGIKMKVKKWVRNLSKSLLFIGVCLVFGLAGNCDLYPTFPMKKVLIYTVISIVLFSPYFFIFIHDIEDDSKK